MRPDIGSNNSIINYCSQLSLFGLFYWSNMELTKYQKVKNDLEVLKNTDEVKSYIDKSAAMREYAKQSGDNDLANWAAEVQIRATRRLGEMIIEQKESGLMNKGAMGNPGGQGAKVVPSTGTRAQKPTLSNMGISYDLSSQAQVIAKMPENDFNQVIDEYSKEKKELTKSAVLKKHRQTTQKEKIEILKEESKKVENPSGLFRCIVIDPPWKMNKIKRDVSPNQQEFDYPTMTVPEIKEIKIPCEEKSHLWLWTTQKYLPDAFHLLEWWGFEYFFTMTWHKAGGFQPFGLPQYNSEFVVFGKNGALPFLETKEFSTCFTGKRREHSRKPDEFYSLVERVSPGPRIDMFSREKRSGFSQFGNEPGRFNGNL